MKIRERLVYELDCDLFAARVRGPHPELVVNEGYEGVLVLDCLRKEPPLRVAYPTDDFSIYSWIMSPDGQRSLLFGSDPSEGALLLDFVQMTSRKLDLPRDLTVASELGWFDPDPTVMDYQGQLWRVRENTMQLLSPAETSSYLTYYYRRVLTHYAAIKADPYERGLYVRSKDFDRRTIGFMPFDGNEEPLLMEHEGDAVDTAVFADILLVSFEKEIRARQGSRYEPVLIAADDQLFVRINVVEHEGKGLLTVISSSEDHLNPNRGQLTVYDLEP